MADAGLPNVLLDRAPKRKWDNVFEFTFTCVSMSIGLGNFWRFPYAAYKHGGGAFLVPYLVILFLVGRPMYYLDLSLGQFSGKSTIGLYYKLAPAWLGLGISQGICCVGVFSYYAHILAMVLWYFINSFTSELPWVKCREEWGDSCISIEQSITNKSNTAMSSSECYLYKVVLQAADNVDDGIGIPDWRMVICLFIVWLFAFIYIIIGVRSTGKIAYFTALYPYLILIILFIRSSVTDGAMDGLLYFFTPDWEKVIKPEVWLAATSQLFFSLGIGYGTVAMYASHNDFRTNIILISNIIAAVDSTSSLLSGMTIFTGLGHLAHRLGVSVEEVIKGDGMSLGFVSYPDAISSFEQVPYIFAIIFFMMFLTLGMGSLCSFQQVVSTNLMEIWPHLKEWHVALITSIMGFVSGIVYTTPGGQAIVTLVDLYGNVYVLMVNAMFTVISVFYVYGLQNWVWDLEFMHKKPSSKIFRLSASLITFLAMATIYIYGCFQNGWLTYNNKPVPAIMMISGYILLAVSSCPIPLTILYFWIHFRKTGLTCGEAWKKTFSSENWVPNEDDLVAEVEGFRKNKIENYPLKGENSTKRFFAALVKNY